MVIAPSPYVFSTMTNICYMAAGFWREAASATDKHSATMLVGQMAGGSTMLVLMGASSFAFHRESQMNSPAHTLDIVFGWLIVSHVFYVSFSVSLLALVHRLTRKNPQSRARGVVRSILSLCFLVVIAMLMTFYDDVYSNQRWFMIGTGVSAAVFGAVCRGILVWEEGEVRRNALVLAAVEMVVALTAVLAAVLAQGELLGRPLSRSTDEAGYDFYHGQWHFLLALVVALLYSRAADAARIVQGTHAVCVCTLPFLDWGAEILIFLYSVLVIAFKEGEVSIIYAKGILGMLAGLFFFHGLVTTLVSLFGDAGDPLVTPRALTPRSGYTQLRQVEQTLSMELGQTPALTFRIRSTR
jgi:hypothetical protein